MRINLLIAWIGILLGFSSGMVMGLFFHRPDWLGGYGSFKRRLYRLAHISLFGLGAVNLFFYLTVPALAAGAMLSVASSLFVIGAITMPVCCVIMAHFPKTQMLFAVPVMSLVAAGALMVVAIYPNKNLRGDVSDAIVYPESKSMSPSPPRSGGEGRGEVALNNKPLTLTLSPFERGEGNDSESQVNLDCGGKRSATPLSSAPQFTFVRSLSVRPKAPSPLRFAGAVHKTSFGGAFNFGCSVFDVGCWLFPIPCGQPSIPNHL